MMRATPFSKILVANRGEIALRVMRTARAHGYRTVAVYSSADAHAPHVDAADQAVWIGESPPAQSYLNIAAIVEAARRTGADAVHPGYGFLAENEHFAAACRDAGLVFIGPSPSAIAAMGNKAGAKRLMTAAGVPCVPGYEGDEQGDARLAVEAERIGYPVMIKAAAGGGGRGMRLVRTPRDFGELLHSAQSEAKNAFGDATVILERAIDEPRHIEIQVFADRHGNAIHLGERDCSVQRRHQKIVEEAPSPAVSPALREQMGAIAVTAAKSIGYEGAGTLEFLLDRQGSFYFMEMNTRLQVEHPVTEAITGLDLVELQLRVAAGEPLPLRQEDVRWTGHAIEVRLCAEDPQRHFMPQGGTIALWQPAQGVRVEHALAAGTTIPPFYDSMIAKVIGHGATREEARRRLLHGLQDTVALGVTTNQAFLARCLAHRVFAEGGATTAFIAEHQTELLRADPAGEDRVVAIAAVLLLETSAGARQRGAARTLAHSLPIDLRFALDGHPQAVTLTHASASRYRVDLDGKQHDIEVVDLDANRARLRCDGIVERATWQREGPRLLLLDRGVPHEVLDTSRAAAARPGGPGGDGSVRAATSGRVVAVLAAVGERVEAGQPIATLEAMKMEQVHLAAVAGVVRALHVAAGDQVAAGDVLGEIEPAPPEQGR
jgi:geranyl-CoA carboxylase alpha subunit